MDFALSVTAVTNNRIYIYETNTLRQYLHTAFFLSFGGLVEAKWLGRTDESSTTCTHLYHIGTARLIFNMLV